MARTMRSVRSAPRMATSMSCGIKRRTDLGIWSHCGNRHSGENGEMFGSLFHGGRRSSGSPPPLHPLGCIRSSFHPPLTAAALVSHRLIDLWHLARNAGLVLPADPNGKLVPRPRREPHVWGRVSAALLGRARLSGCTSIVAGSLRRCRLSVQSWHLCSALPAPTRCRLVVVRETEPIKSC